MMRSRAFFRVGHTFEGFEKAVTGSDTNYVEHSKSVAAELRSTRTLFPQEPVVHEETHLSFTNGKCTSAAARLNHPPGKDR